MSGQDGTPPNRTVIFRPSPLAESKTAQPPPKPRPTASGQASSLSLSRDDIPAPPKPAQMRNRMVHAAAPLLSLLASVRSGRAQVDLPRLHAMITEAVAGFSDAMRGGYPEEHVKRAIYALCATADDIVLNLPGEEKDTAEWAQRSIVVHFFAENIGGDRYWILLDQMIAQPASYPDLLELYHACMACGFEGRYRVIASGKSEHRAKMQATYQALTHPRELSVAELSPHWRGILTEIPRMTFWTPLLLAAGVAAVALLLIYLGYLYALYTGAGPATDALNRIELQAPLKLTRQAAPMAPPTSIRLNDIKQFLAPEIQAGLVEVLEDASSIRVRATAKTMFDSGKAELRPENQQLIDRIADALDDTHGPISVQGYTDSTQISSPAFPNNFALSQARAESVAALIRQHLKDPSRASAQGFGETHPLASNATPDGRARNRRVEVTIPREGN
jgi:type VI secretion system peptidoglycan-associated protein